jgi:hypothetical protein
MYKKIFLVFVSIVAIQTVKAQTEKGSQMLGVSFGFSTSSSDSKSLNTNDNTYGVNSHGKQTTYNFATNYSYFIADKLDIGASIGYGQSKQEYTNSSNWPLQKSHGFNSSIYLRKYFLYDNKIGIRTGPYLMYANSKQTYLNSDFTPGYYSSDNDIYNGGIGLDFVYFPIKRLGLAAGMGNISYTHQITDGYSKGTSNSFGLNFANSLNLSVNYVFGK